MDKAKIAKELLAIARELTAKVKEGDMYTVRWTSVAKDLGLDEDGYIIIERSSGKNWVVRPYDRDKGFGRRYQIEKDKFEEALRTDGMWKNPSPGTNMPIVDPDKVYKERRMEVLKDFKKSANSAVRRALDEIKKRLRFTIVNGKILEQPKLEQKETFRMSGYGGKGVYLKDIGLGEWLDVSKIRAFNRDVAKIFKPQRIVLDTNVNGNTVPIKYVMYRDVNVNGSVTVQLEMENKSRVVSEVTARVKMLYQKLAEELVSNAPVVIYDAIVNKEYDIGFEYNVIPGGGDGWNEPQYGPEVEMWAAKDFVMDVVPWSDVVKEANLGDEIKALEDAGQSPDLVEIGQKVLLGISPFELDVEIDAPTSARGYGSIVKVDKAGIHVKIDIPLEGDENLENAVYDHVADYDPY